MGKKRVRELAGQMADTHLRRTGITKAAGTVQRDDLLALYTPVAEGIEVLERVARALDKRAKQQDRAAEMIARQVRMLQAMTAVEASPGLRGFTDYDPGVFRLQHVPGEVPPKKTNGHSSHGEGAASASPPIWHPENDGGV